MFNIKLLAQAVSIAVGCQAESWMETSRIITIFAALESYLGISAMLAIFQDLEVGPWNGYNM